MGGALRMSLNGENVMQPETIKVISVAGKITRVSTLPCSEKLHFLGFDD